AGAGDVGRAGQRQVLDRAEDGGAVGGQVEADRTLHRVRAAAAGLVDAVAGVVDHVGIIAGSAGQRVGPGAAIERVIAAVAGDDVVQPVAGARDVGRARQCQVLDRANDGGAIRGQVVADRTLHRVDAVAAGLVDDIAGVVDDAAV